MSQLLCCVAKQTEPSSKIDQVDHEEEELPHRKPEIQSEPVPTSDDQPHPEILEDERDRMGPPVNLRRPKRTLMPNFLSNSAGRPVSLPPVDHSKVIFNPAVTLEAESSESVYKSARSVFSSADRQSYAVSTEALDSSTPSLTSNTNSRSNLHPLAQERSAVVSNHTLVSRMEEVMQKQHREFMEELKEFTSTVVAEIKTSRAPENDTCTDGVHTERVEETCIRESMLPFKTSVSSMVLLKLSKRNSRWKFLARWLKIPEHEIDKISVNHKEDVQEQSYQMLLWWTQSNGGGSYPVLGEALKQEYGEQLYSDYVKMVIETEGKHSLVANSQ